MSTDSEISVKQPMGPTHVFFVGPRRPRTLHAMFTLPCMLSNEEGGTLEYTLSALTALQVGSVSMHIQQTVAIYEYRLHACSVRSIISLQSSFMTAKSTRMTWIRFTEVDGALLWSL